MAAVSGSPIPEHVPTAVTTATTYTVPSELGIVFGTPSGAAAYTLPVIATLVVGSRLTIFNLHASNVITVTAGTGNTIAGAATLALRGGANVTITPPVAGTDWISEGVKSTNGTMVMGPSTATTQATSNTTAVTLNGNCGKIAMFGNLTTAADAISAAFAVTNSFVGTASTVIAQVVAYTGTIVTNGVPVAVVSGIGSGTFNVQILNVGTAALAGTVTINFIVM
jgi:hypothetical protein